MLEKLNKKLKTLFKQKETNKEKYEKVLKHLQAKQKELHSKNDDDTKEQLEAIKKLIKRTQDAIKDLK